MLDKQTFSHILQGILDELSVRIDEGIVDLKNSKHLQKLGEIFDEMELYQVGDQLIENLMREDDDYTHIGAGIYVAKRDVDPDGGAKDGAQKYRKDGEGETASYTAISDEEAEQIKQKQGDAGEKAAASFNQQQAKDGGEGDGEGEEQERGTALDPSTSSGKDYTDQLPPEDPASTAQKKKEKEVGEKIRKEKSNTSNNKTDKTLGKQQQKDLDKMKSNSENWKDQLDEEKQKLLEDAFYHIEIVMSEDATDEEKKQSAEWLVENIGFATNENKSKAYLGKLGGLRKILSNMAGGGSAGTKRLVAEMEKHVELKETNFSGIKKQLTSAAKPDLGKENEFSPKKNPKVQSFFEGHPQLSKIRSGLWGLFGVAGEDGKIKMPSNQYPKEYLKQSFDNPALTRTIEKAQQFVDSGDLDPKYVQALKDHQERLARITEQYEIPSEEAARAIDDSYEKMVVELHEADSDAAGSVLKQLAENRLYEVELARGEEVYLPSNGSFPGGDKIKVDTLERVSLVSCKWGKQGRIYGCPANAKAVTSLHPDESKRENQGQYLGEDGYTLLVKDELIKGNTIEETKEKTKSWIKNTLNEVGLSDVFSDDELTQISEITTEYLEFVESVKRELEGVTPAEKYWTLFNQKIAEKEKEIGDRLREVVSDEQIEKLIGKNNVGNLTTNNRILPQNLLGAIEISNSIRTSDGYGLEHNKQYFEKGKSKFVTDKGTSDPNDYSITFRDKRTAGRNGGGVQMSFSGDSGDKIDVNIGDSGDQTDSENNPIID